MRPALRRITPTAVNVIGAKAMMIFPQKSGQG
jgi:hypothetical protein